MKVGSITRKRNKIIATTMPYKTFLKDTFGWGFVLWLFGYILGFALFFIVPASVLGWVVMPFGVLLTLWVLYKKVSTDTFSKRIAL